MEGCEPGVPVILPSTLSARGGGPVESRILSSPVAAGPWEFATLPDAWRIGAHRNVGAGALAALLSLPLAMGLGALAFSPLGSGYVTAGVLAGLYGAAFLGLVAVLA